VAIVYLYLILSSVHSVVCIWESPCYAFQNEVLSWSRGHHEIAIELHIGRYKLVIRAIPTIAAPCLIEPLTSLEEKLFWVLDIYRRVGILFTPYPLHRSSEELWRRCFILLPLLTQIFFRITWVLLEWLRYRCDRILFLVPPVCLDFFRGVELQGVLVTFAIIPVPEYQR
jgi:hypothetical protein